MNRFLIGALFLSCICLFEFGCEKRPAENIDQASKTSDQTWDAASARHIDALSARMTAAQGLSVTVTRHETQSAFGVEKKATTIHRLSVDRPQGCFSLTCDRASRDTDGSLISDGRQMVMAQIQSGHYSVYAAPGMDAILRSRELAVMGGAAGWFSAMLLSEDPKAAFAYGLDHAEGVYDDQAQAETVEQIRLVGYETSYDIWFDRKQPGIPVRVRFEGEADEGTQVTELHFSDWRFEKPTDTDFVFKPSDRMKKVATLFEAAAHPLVDQPAPDFELQDASGAKVRLSSLRGRVVVLDFWATWCGPCMIGLPIVREETAAVADRGVVFHAVNLQESAEVVRAFEVERSWSLPVLFDTEGAVAKAYGAPPIPLTVLIDRAGVIRRVHTGVSPLTYRAELKQDLAHLLDGIVKN